MWLDVALHVMTLGSDDDIFNLFWRILLLGKISWACLWHAEAASVPVRYPTCTGNVLITSEPHKTLYILSEILIYLKYDTNSRKWKISIKPYVMCNFNSDFRDQKPKICKIHPKVLKKQHLCCPVKPRTNTFFSFFCLYFLTFYFTFAPWPFHKFIYNVWKGT